MAFTKIENSDLTGVGVIGLPDKPGLSTAAMQSKLEETSRSVVIPKHNALIDELQASTAAADLGAVAPTGRTGTSVQSVLNSLSTDLGTAEAQSHAHPNKAVIDKFADDGTGLTYDGNPVGAVTSVNSQTGAVVLTASDVGALPSTTAIPTKTSDLTNDSGFITASSLPTKTSQLTNDSGFITSGDIPTIPTKTSDLTNDSNFVADSSYVHTDNNYDATAKGIVDGATAAIAAKSTVAWNQNITTGQKIATVTIDGTPTDVYAPTGGGGGGGAVDSVNGQTGIVTLGVGDLDDVSISSLASQQTIVYDGTEWGNEALADVALSGSYNDLSDQPTIPTVDQTYSATSGNAQSGTAVAEVVEQIYADNGVLGAKNILENTASDKSDNNVSFVVNANKSVTVTTSGTVSAVTTLAIGEFKPLKETMVMNGVTGGSQSTYGFQLYDVTTSQWITQYATDGDSEITLDISHTYRVILFVRNGVASGLNTTVYPMVSLSGGEYVPYAMTNRELTERFAVLEFTTDATNTDNNLSYPVGFNQNNTYAFLFMVKDGGGNWREGIGTLNTGERVFCVLKPDVITVSIITGDYKNKDMKILLMKI